MVVDEWRGLGVYRSDDAVNWTRQGLILDRPGTDPDDRQIGHHADVVPNGDEAAIYYFTHPHWSAANPDPQNAAERRTTIHAARLLVENGELVCRRNEDPSPLNTDREAASSDGPSLPTHKETSDAE